MDIIDKDTGKDKYRGRVIIRALVKLLKRLGTETALDLNPI